MCVDKVGTICVGKNVTLKMKNFEVFEVGMGNGGFFSEIVLNFSLTMPNKSGWEISKG